VLDEVPDPERAAKEIVTRARARGSRDDITALVIELAEW
jgi:serine/threonine protein phosphatase PrpC